MLLSFLSAQLMDQEILGIDKNLRAIHSKNFQTCDVIYYLVCDWTVRVEGLLDLVNFTLKYSLIIIYLDLHNQQILHQWIVLCTNCSLDTVLSQTHLIFCSALQTTHNYNTSPLFTKNTVLSHPDRQHKSYRTCHSCLPIKQIPSHLWLFTLYIR